MPPEKHEAARDAGPLCTETASAVNEEMDILSRRIFILIAAVAALLLPGGMLKAETAPVVKDGKVVDYKVAYTTDYLGQMMEYGRKYSTL